MIPSVTQECGYEQCAAYEKGPKFLGLHSQALGTWFVAETLWLRPGLREQAGSAARLIEKGVVCWLHRNRGLLLEKPIRMFGEGHEVPIRQTK